MLQAGQIVLDRVPRRAAIEVLGQLRAPEILPRLEKTLAAARLPEKPAKEIPPTDEMAFAALGALQAMGTPAAAKLLENIYRAVNIALVNELKVLLTAMGIDVWEVIQAASTKPFGFQAFYPGPGLGGHCIPIDPFYLTWKAREVGLPTRFIELAGEINHAGAIFLGSFTPAAAGDYFAGPNHVLPTGGGARFSSALGVYDFVKRTSILRYSAAELSRSAKKIAALADAEGFDAHARSAKIRVS